MNRRRELILLKAAPDLAIAAVRWVEGGCAHVGLDEQRAMELSAAVIEAVNNSLEHGYRMEPGEVSLTLDADDDRVAITVIDRGTGLPAQPSAAIPAPFAERGRGAWIMQRSCDNVRHEIRDGLQSVVLVKLRHPIQQTSNGDLA